MTNPIADTNVIIIGELKKFMKDSVMIAENRVQYIQSASKDFTRRRVLTFEILVLLILNALKRSLSIEIQNFFEQISLGVPCSKQAFCEQRAKLSHSFFHDWNQVLVKSFYQHYGDRVKTWNGFRLLAVDGSTLPLPDSEALREKFGGATNQIANSLTPTVRVCVLYDVLNNIAIRGILRPYFVSEDDMTIPCIENQANENTLLLFDRGYPSYWLMYRLLQMKTNFVMRVSQSANNAVKSFVNSEEDDIIIDMYPPYSSRKRLKDMGIMIDKHTTIRVRLVKVLLNTGEVEVLISNLYDTALYTIEEMKEVYHLRWGIETFYGYMKEELQLGQFSGIREICIQQDFAANLFLFNLQSLIEKQTQPYVDAVSKKRVHDYKVNKNISWASLKNRVVKLFIEEDSLQILIELQKLFEWNLIPIRPGRKYSRMKKRNYNGKYHTLTNYKRAI